MLNFAEVLLVIVRGVATGATSIALFSFTVFAVTTSILLLRHGWHKER